MKNNNRLSAFLAILSIALFTFGCEPKSTTTVDVTTPENVEVYVYDSTQVNSLMDNALNVEEIGKPMVIKDSFSVITTTYFKVTVALDENNKLIMDPNGQPDQSTQTTERRGSNGTAVVSIGCEYSCQRHTDDEGCATGGCFSNGKGRCSAATCGTCKTTLKCRPIKSGFGMGGAQIMF